MAGMEERNAFRVLTDKLTENRPLGRPRHRSEDNILIHLKEICVNKRKWIDSANGMDY